MADIILINPKFEISFWGLEHALPMFGKRANMPVAALPLLAALTPAEHRITLIDENVEEIDFDRWRVRHRRPHRHDRCSATGCAKSLTELKRAGCLHRRGRTLGHGQAGLFRGALPTSSSSAKPRSTWPRFLDDWRDGRAEKRYEQKDKTDMSQVPLPRFDLLKLNRYLFGSLQSSRGCPFQCEFCDIIVIFGRRPRIKSAEQVIAEIEALRARKA